MSDLSIRPVSIAEHAKLAARQAVDTWTPAQNPHEPGSADHAAWEAAYARWFDAFTAPEGVEEGCA